MFDFHLDIDKLITQLTYNAKDPLLFNSGFFLFFFCIFLLGYQFLYKRKLTRVVYFTIFSLYFFYKACGFYFGFILLSAVVDFNLSNWIYTAKTEGRKKAILIFSIAINLGFTVGGAVQIETVFSWPGLGGAIFEALDRRDFPILQGAFLLLAISVIFANLLADLTYTYLDPRVQTE